MHSLQFNIYFRCVIIRLNSAKEVRGKEGGGDKDCMGGRSLFLTTCS